MAHDPPLIGLTLDAEAAGGYSKFPWYALRQNYAGAITAVGGVALALPHEPATIASYLEVLDGLVVTGGAFDVDPALYGAQESHASVVTKDARTAFELAVLQAFLEADKPVLGICGGQQLLHVALGGRLIQHIPDGVADALAHEQPNPRDEPGHEVSIVPGTVLHGLVRTERLAVNSAHHQAAADEPAGVVVNARADDGVIEGIEVPSKRFCIGVQWHPEFFIQDGDRALLRGFIAACRDHA